MIRDPSQRNFIPGLFCFGQPRGSHAVQLTNSKEQGGALERVSRSHKSGLLVNSPAVLDRPESDESRLSHVEPKSQISREDRAKNIISPEIFKAIDDSARKRFL